MHRLFLSSSLLAVSAAVTLAGGSIIPNPVRGRVNVIIRDAAGNLYLGGGAASSAPGSNSNGAFVAELSSDGSKLIFQTALSSSDTDGVTALALAPDGSILAAGVTKGGLNVTPDAAEPQPAGLPNFTGFFARLNPSGGIAYASYLNEAASDFGISPPLAMTADSAGAAYITGEGSYFVTKLDAAGKPVWTNSAIGGTVIALGSQGSVYLAGSASSYNLPVTAGAFQSSVANNSCMGNDIFNIACTYQYVAKLDSTGSKIPYATWLSGSYGATPFALVVDGAGNAIVAGTTKSSDYPVTPGAYQPANFSTEPMPPLITRPGEQLLNFPFTGYVSKLNANGSALVFSTYLGGAVEDSVGSIALDAAGNLYLAGMAASPDFPGTAGVPDGCRPNFVYPQPFLTRLSADGSSLTGTTLLFANFGNLGEASPSPVELLLSPGGDATVSWNGQLANLSLAPDAARLACATDAASHAPVTSLAPGQLVTLFGNSVGEYTAVTLKPQNGVVPSSLGDGSAVKIHGIPAPILYSSQNQINVQVPYEVASQSAVKLEIDNPEGAVASTQEFEVAAGQPSAFSNGVLAVCGSSLALPSLTLARNADGSVNTCANPAGAGSTVTLYLNGLGKASGGLLTGAIAAAPAAAVTEPLAVYGDAQFVSAQSEPGSINGVWAVKVKLTALLDGGSVAADQFAISAGGAPAGAPLTVWVAPAQ